VQDCGLAILGVHGHGSFFMRVPFFIFLSLPILLAGESFPVRIDRESQTLSTPVQIGSMSFPAGLVFDSRIFETLAQVPPVQAADSAAPQMQHMAVVRDFTLTK